MPWSTGSCIVMSLCSKSIDFGSWARETRESRQLVQVKVTCLLAGGTGTSYKTLIADLLATRARELEHSDLQTDKQGLEDYNTLLELIGDGRLHNSTDVMSRSQVAPLKRGRRIYYTTLEAHYLAFNTWYLT